MTNSIADMTNRIPPNQIHVRKSQTTTDTYHFDRDKLLLMMREAGVIIPDGASVQLYMRVPGGGDWSNTDLEVERGQPLVLIVTHHTVEEETTE